MPMQGSRRLLFIVAAFTIVVVFGFYLRPTRITTWPTANAPAAVGGDYYDRFDLKGDEEKHESLAAPQIQTPALAPPVATSKEVAPVMHTSSTPKGASPAIQTAVSTPQETATVGSAASSWDSEAYIEVSSSMTKDKRWFPIDFGDYGSYNPNLIPHPWKNDTWVMIAQGKQPPGEVKNVVYSLELYCDAVFKDGKMQCERSPTSVPVASTVSEHCTGDMDFFNYMIGPNDPRVFFGPDRPYITYGSASQYTCLGQWIHDLRRLVRWNSLEALDKTQRFFWPTELQRPLPYSGVEKNWFAFWDDAGDMYLHYNIHPKRSFAKVAANSSDVSQDLAPAAAIKDDLCIERYMPKLVDKEHIHQATNSLAITMCKRSDTACDKAKNTFIFTIFHHKQYHGHNLYEPYIMMFEQSAPFHMYAVSSKPFWINGRGKPGEAGVDRPADQSQMMYITSMSWKASGLTYHGYMDDELMISFGIEDSAAGAIDVVAEDLIRKMHVC